MGPTPFSVGDTCGRSTIRARYSSFNGANAIQRWRQGNSRWSWSADTRFNGANAIQRWRHTNSSTSSGRSKHFNGANAIQRWRQRGTKDTVVRYNGLQWGQRHSALETAGTRRVTVVVYRLQWGPTPFSVGDGANEEAGSQPAGLASMGPTPFSVGDSKRVWEEHNFQIVLQWGQRHSALETFLRSATYRIWF